MARVTVEDCVERVPNRFELVLLAAQRARAISAGEALTLDRDNDKNPVVALREIAEATVPADRLRDALTRTLVHGAVLEEVDDEEDPGELGIGDSFSLPPSAKLAAAPVVAVAEDDED